MQFVYDPRARGGRKEEKKKKSPRSDGVEERQNSLKGLKSRTHEYSSEAVADWSTRSRGEKPIGGAGAVGPKNLVKLMRSFLTRQHGASNNMFMFQLLQASLIEASFFIKLPLGGSRVLS